MSAGGGGCDGLYMYDGDLLISAVNVGAGVVAVVVVLLVLGVIGSCWVRCAGGGLYGRCCGAVVITVIAMLL
eukprot:8343581-Pyramimonas_sp.AAC.1